MEHIEFLTNGERARSSEDRSVILGGGYIGIALAMIHSAVAGLAATHRKGFWVEDPTEMRDRLADIGIGRHARRVLSAELAAWENGLDHLLALGREIGLNWSRDTVLRKAVEASEDPKSDIGVGNLDLARGGA